MMTAQFSAVQIACLEEDGVLTVAFGGVPVGDSDPPYLLLSRTLVPDAQDVRRGQDRPYLELSDQSKSVYGGVNSVHLSPRHIRVALDARGAKGVGATQIYVALASSNEYDRVEQALKRILDGVNFNTGAA